MSRSLYPTDVIQKAYDERAQEFGEDPRALYWTGKEEQFLRLRVLLEIAASWTTESVLDVGCGFCDLFTLLSEEGFRGTYVGLDISANVLDIARKRFPKLDVRQTDLLSLSATESFDYVIASGTFNITFGDRMEEYIGESLKKMFQISKIGIAVNFLSTYVDFQRDVAHHTDPKWLFDQAKQLTKRALLRHDYMPYEFSAYIWKDDQVRSGNVFSAYSRTD